MGGWSLKDMPDQAGRVALVTGANRGLGFETSLALAGANAMAESQYGSGTGTITAQARVNLSVTVPKLILLRVGSTDTTIDTVTWASTLSIPPVPTAPQNASSRPPVCSSSSWPMPAYPSIASRLLN